VGDTPCGGCGFRSLPDCERLLVHIDEAMSWESVRDLDKMRSALLLVRNLPMRNGVPGEIVMSVNEVAENLDEVFSEIAKGKRL